jgi:hypothetical protein
MPFRARASAIAVTAAICTLLAPAAMASPGVSHSGVQVTGKKLKGGLLPPSRFQPSYSTIFASNSGGSLEHGALFHTPSMKCSTFWSFIGTVKGFGETAFATESAASKSGKAPVVEIFSQSVYQFASNHAATVFNGQISAKYKSCRSVSFSDGQGGTLRETVHARKAERVGGHQSLLLTEYLTDSKIGGPPLVTDALWTIDGTDVYMVNSQLLNVRSPKPTLSSLMLKLIARVRAIR